MNNYSSSDICVLTPTKDRPHKIVNLLDSLVRQTCQVGRVIVVGSGQDISDVVGAYQDRLPIEYYHSEIAGQIRQRKLGVSLLYGTTKLVATLDDDIILESDAIENILKFWNSKEADTAGVGFNITNMTPHSYSRVKSFLFLSDKKPGKVLLSGFPTSIVNVVDNISTSWLNGGATLWNQEILIRYIHSKNIDATWAPCEDLMFSYPIGKIKKLWVCRDAKVVHDDFLDDNLSFDQYYNKGKLLTYWLLIFVIQEKSLSIFSWFVSNLAKSLTNIIVYFSLLKFNKLGIPFGTLIALVKGSIYFLIKKDISPLVSKL